MDKTSFSPVERLIEREIKTILEAYITMPKTWSAQIDFLEKMPLKERYEFLRNKVLEVAFTPNQGGFILISVLVMYRIANGKFIVRVSNTWNKKIYKFNGLLSIIKL